MNLAYIAQREEVIDFTAMYQAEELRLLSAAAVEKDRSLAVFYPFSIQVIIVYCFFILEKIFRPFSI